MYKKRKETIKDLGWNGVEWSGVDGNEQFTMNSIDVRSRQRPAGELCTSTGPQETKWPGATTFRGPTQNSIPY